MSARKSPRPLHAGKRWGINAKWTGEQAIHNSQWSRRCARRARLWLSHLSVQHGCSASSHRSALRLRGVPWLRTALCSVCSPLQPFGPPMFASSLAALPASLGSSTAIAATGCAVSFALIGLTTACFRHRRRPSCAPLGTRGAFWLVALSYEVALPKASFFPQGKGRWHGVSRDGGIGRWHGVAAMEGLTPLSQLR